MDLTQGAIEAIQKPVREAEALTKAVVLLDYPEDPTRKLLVQSGQHEVLNVPPPLRKHQVGIANDELDHSFPVRFVIELPAKASGDHRIDDGFVAAEAEDLSPSKCLLDGVAVWGLAEMADHCLGHS